MENKLTDKEIIERKMLTAEFMDSLFYKKYFEPHVQGLIDDADRISNIDEKDVERTYLKNKNKRDVYRGLLNKFESWLKKGVNNNKI